MALIRLDESGWANHVEPGMYPDAEARAAMLAEAIEMVRLLKPLT